MSGRSESDELEEERDDVDDVILILADVFPDMESDVDCAVDDEDDEAFVVGGIANLQRRKLPLLKFSLLVSVSFLLLQRGQKGLTWNRQPNYSAAVDETLIRLQNVLQRKRTTICHLLSFGNEFCVSFLFLFLFLF